MNTIKEILKEFLKVNVYLSNVFLFSIKYFIIFILVYPDFVKEQNTVDLSLNERLKQVYVTSNDSIVSQKL